MEKRKMKKRKTKWEEIKHILRKGLQFRVPRSILEKAPLLLVSQGLNFDELYHSYPSHAGARPILATRFSLCTSGPKNVRNCPVM